MRVSVLVVDGGLYPTIRNPSVMSKKGSSISEMELPSLATKLIKASSSSLLQEAAPTMPSIYLLCNCILFPDLVLNVSNKTVGIRRPHSTSHRNAANLAVVFIIKRKRIQREH